MANPLSMCFHTDIHFVTTESYHLCLVELVKLLLAVRDWVLMETFGVSCSLCNHLVVVFILGIPMCISPCGWSWQNIMNRVASNQQKCILIGSGGQESSINADIVSSVGLFSAEATGFLSFFSPCILMWWKGKGHLPILLIKNLVLWT